MSKQIIDAIDGDTVLPQGFDHPHASEEARLIAESGTILRAQVGSGVHGTSISGQDDRDEMGICLEPPEYVTGIARVPAGVNAQTGTVEFEQYQRHTVLDQPGGLANRSGAGDLDVVIYSARGSGVASLSPAIRPFSYCCSFPTMKSSTEMRSAPSSSPTRTGSYRNSQPIDSLAICGPKRRR